MKYNFKDILNKEIYDNTRVMIVTGKYQLFNNLVADTLKEMSSERSIPNSSMLGLANEFDIDDDSNDIISTSVDIDTFFDVANVSNINGKWFCRVSLESINKKQKEQLLKYIKQPSKNAILVILSNDYKDYAEFLKNKIIITSRYAHIMQLSFPNKNILKSIVIMMFEDKGIEIDSQSADYFIMRLSTEYDKYEEVIEDIVGKHEQKELKLTDMKTYLKHIEYFDINDFMYELVKPLSSGKTGNKKIVRMLSTLKDKYDAEQLVIELQKMIIELIDYRIMINKGYITINIRYIFNDVIKLLGPDNKYSSVNEWVFRKKADLASLTSLTDWVYMNIILNKALSVGFSNSKERKMACERALYALITRSVLSESRINNVVGLDNILYENMKELNKVLYEEDKIKELV